MYEECLITATTFKALPGKGFHHHKVIENSYFHYLS